MKKRSPLLIIFMTVVLDLTGFGLVIPLLPFYAQDYGASAVAIGGLTATFSIGQLIFTPLFGAWSDRIGRRPVILFSLLISSLSFSVIGIGGSLWVLFLGRVVNGIAASSIGVAQAYIADITTPENRAKGMGLIGAAFGIGFVIGPALGGTVGSIYRPLPFFISSGLALLNLVLGWFLLEESLTGKLREQARNNLSRQIRTPLDLIKRLGQALSRPALRLPILIFFFFNVSFTSFEMALPLFTQKRYGYDSHQNGYLFAFVGVLVVIMQGGVIGLVVKKFGERRTLQVGLALVTLSLALVPVGSWLAILLLVLALIAVGEGISTPTSTALISLASRADEQGEIMGISQGTSSMARIIGPLLGGIIFSSTGEVWPFLAASILMGVALVLALALKPIIRTSEVVAAASGGNHSS